MFSSLLFRAIAPVVVLLVVGGPACVAAIAQDDAHHAPPADPKGTMEHGDHHVHIGASEADEHSGLFDFRTDLAVYTFIVFLLLLVLLWRFAFGPIAQKLDEREAGIRRNIEDARAEREKAEQLRGEYQGMLEAADDKVRALFAEAHAKAEQVRAEKLAEAHREAEQHKERALGEIERAKDQAVQELFDAMGTAVAQATEQVLGRTVTDQDQSRLIDEALAGFSTRHQSS
jgi:F-type H+-transporting ATPase subunit b